MTLSARTGKLSRLALAALFAIMLCVGYAPQVGLAVGFGDTLRGGLNSAAPEALQSTVTDPATIVGNIIGTVIGLLGALLLGYLLYGGFTWMTAGGDKGKVDEAQKVIRNAVIGMVIIAMSYAISTFVINSLEKVTSPGGGGTVTPEAPKK